MPEAVQLLFEQLGIALALGILVGLQRERADPVIAGLRTFPIITMLGTLAAAMDMSRDAQGWIIAAGFVSIVAVVSVTNLHRLRHPDSDFGMTTEVAILMMYAVGAYLVVGHRVVSVAAGAVVAVLLQFKPELHGMATRLGDQDLRAIMTFVLITCIVLPVLPNTTYDLVAPLNVLNPFEIWLMVVLMVGISLSGYLAYKFVGRNAGIMLGGILGGAVSSTATTISYAKRTRAEAAHGRMAALVIVIASSVSFVRVLIEIFLVAPQQFIILAPPILVMMSVGVLVAVVTWLRVQREPVEPPAPKNPTQWRSAVVFAVLYAGVLMALAAAKAYLGGQGLYGIAIVSGLTDMDAITLSISRMVRLGANGGLATSDAWRLIVVASLGNLVFKWLMAAAAGGPALRRHLALLFAAPFAAGCLVLLFWPV